MTVRVRVSTPRGTCVRERGRCVRMLMVVWEAVACTWSLAVAGTWRCQVLRCVVVGSHYVRIRVLNLVPVRLALCVHGVAFTWQSLYLAELS